MKYTDQCSCRKNEVIVNTSIDFGNLVPRSCDCNSCLALSLPAALVSDPAINISIGDTGSGLKIRKNGSEQAFFYHCKHCDQLLAVGAKIENKYRGAVNALIFKHIRFSTAKKIRPRMLSPAEKIQRWKEIWGNLYVAQTMTADLNE